MENPFLFSIIFCLVSIHAQIQPSWQNIFPQFSHRLERTSWQGKRDSLFAILRAKQASRPNALAKAAVYASVPANAPISARFYGSGPDDQVTVIDTSGSNVYIGGAFHSVGPLKTNRVARWDGSKWNEMGLPAGYDGTVLALAAFGNDVYVGGNFQDTATKDTAYLFHWNGSTWQSSRYFNGSQVQSITVVALTYYDGAFYGAYSIADLGTVWGGVLEIKNDSTTSIGETQPFNTSINILKAGPDGVYCGGNFSSIGFAPPAEISANDIAKWNGSSWEALGSGVRSSAGIGINAMEFFKGNLFVGGGLDSAGNVACTRVAIWDGQQWTSGNDVIGIITPVIKTMTSFQNSLYIGIGFGSGTDTSASQIYRWDGQVLTKLVRQLKGEITYYPVLNVLKAVSGSQLFMGGEFLTVEGVNAMDLASWNGQEWSNAGVEPDLGLDQYVLALATDGSSLFAGGGFGFAGDQFANGIADLQNNVWKGLGKASFKNLNDNIDIFFPFFTSLSFGHGILYAGGDFQDTENLANLEISSWDGSQWKPLGNGLAQTASVIQANKTGLYVDGYISNPLGSNALGNLFEWSGTQWENLGNSTTPTFVTDGGIISTLDTMNGALYAGGDFDSIAGVYARGIAQWNNNIWAPLQGPHGEGTSGTVVALLASNQGLFVGGEFDSAGGQLIQNLAIWSNGEWKEPVPGSGGFPYFVTSLALYGNDLIVGWENGDSAGVDIWSGSEWIPLGRCDFASSNDISPSITAMEMIGNYLYIGGEFNEVNSIPSLGLAQIDLTNINTSIRTTQQCPKSAVITGLFSDPFPLGSRAAGIFAGMRDGSAAIFDMQGRKIETILGNIGATTKQKNAPE